MKKMNKPHWPSWAALAIIVPAGLVAIASLEHPDYSIDKVEHKQYAVGNINSFERISHAVMPTVPEAPKEPSRKMVFSELFKTELEQKELEEISLYLQSLQKTILQTKKSSIERKEIYLLFPYMRQHLHGQGTDSRKNTTQGRTWLYICLSTKSPPTAFWSSEGTRISSREVFRAISGERGSSPSHQLYNGRQSAREPVNKYQYESSQADAPRNEILSQGVYSGKTLTRRIDGIYQAKNERNAISDTGRSNSVQGHKEWFTVTAYCPCT